MILKRRSSLCTQGGQEAIAIITFTIYRSVGFGSFMTATEKVVYQASSENPEHTVAVKSAWVESSFYGLRTAIKNFGIERFKKNCVKATEGFNYVLEKFSRQQASLRELGTVKLAEFQVWPQLFLFIFLITLSNFRSKKIC